MKPEPVVKVEEKIPEPVPVVVSVPAPVAKVETVVVTEAPKVESPPVAVQEVQPAEVAPEVKKEKAPQEGREKGSYRGGNNKGPRPEGERKIYNNNNDGEKKVYRPKYQEKEG